MGCAVGPLLADVYLDELESNFLTKENMEKLGLRWYRRYVDDTLIVMKDPEAGVSILEWLNGWDPHIKYTFEGETDYGIAFLDILIQHGEQEGYVTSVYRKKTYTGRLIHADSKVPNRFKWNMAWNLLDRGARLSTKFDLQSREVCTIWGILRFNGYTNEWISRVVDKFFARLSLSKVGFNKVKNKNKEVHDIVRVKIPYNGKFKVIEKAVNEACWKLRKWGNGKRAAIQFFNNNNIKSWVSNKVCKANNCISQVIYQFKCGSSGCPASYVGETKRLLQTRIEEHMKGVPKSSIFEHLQCSGHSCSLDDFRVLCFANSEFKRRCKESVAIALFKPSLNVQKMSMTLLTII